MTFATPQDLGFDASRYQRAVDTVRQLTERDTLPAVGLCVGRRAGALEPVLVGKQVPGADGPLRRDALFLVASITKPLTVTAVMMLMERGLLSLEDKVAQFLPRFAVNGKDAVQVRHLMTHTSGLPDMVPNNDRLRAEHRPLSAFVDEIYELPLAFAPGTRVSYQSAGTAILGKLVQELTGVALPDFLRKEIFEPLGMLDTSLGYDPAKRDRIASIRLNADQARTNWHWNTPYWLGFGAPWGGMITSPADFARLCQLMLGGGTREGVRILSPATVRAMTSNQLQGMADMMETERRCRPWGLGWRLNWPGHSANFGDLLGPNTFGHWGATGTLCWMDPVNDTFLVLFTTQPQEPEGRYLSRISNLVAAALSGPL